MRKERIFYRIKALSNNRIFKLSYLLILFGIVIYCLFRWKNEFFGLITEANLWMVPWIFTGFWGATIIFVFIQYYVYRQMEVHISFLKVLRIVSFANLGKYVPGKVFFPGNYFLFSREAGIEARDVGASFVISQCFWLLSAFICSIPVIFVLSSPLRYSIVFLPLVIGLFIYPKTFNWIFSLLERIIQKYLKQEVSLRMSKHLGYVFYIKIILLSLLGWVINGFLVYFSVITFYPLGIRDFPICLSAGAISVVISFITIFAPAGIGVREGIGTVVLATIVPVEVAFFAMIMIRILATIIDLSFALVSTFFIHTS